MSAGGWRLPVVHEQWLMATAFYLGLALAIGVVVLMAAIVLMRLGLVLQRRRERAFLARWRPKLMKHLIGEDVKLPRLKPNERVLLFGLWSHMYEAVRGGAREQLNAFAREAGLDEVAWRFVASPNPRKQLIGLLALGNLKEGRAWFTFVEHLERDSAVHSLAALRGMLLLDPRRAMSTAVGAIARRSDWSPVRVASFLKEAGSETTYRVLARAALKSPPDEAVRLVKYMSATRCYEALPEVRRLLNETDHPGLIAACLQMLREPQDLPPLRRFAKHPIWFVRLQAAIALGRLGEEGDEQLLDELLRDPNWWVRYRAAQALKSLPFVGTGQLTELQLTHEDGYARDILRQVLTEQPLA